MGNIFVTICTAGTAASGIYTQQTGGRQEFVANIPRQCFDKQIEVGTRICDVDGRRYIVSSIERIGEGAKCGIAKLEALGLLSA